LTEEEVMALMQRCLEYYAKHAKTRERMPRFIERIGVEEFKKAVL
jgi:dissimilatory sulfite reductase (desulfoviridin) alpha/beta subunit